MVSLPTIIEFYSADVLFTPNMTFTVTAVTFRAATVDHAATILIYGIEGGYGTPMNIVIQFLITEHPEYRIVGTADGVDMFPDLEIIRTGTAVHRSIMERMRAMMSVIMRLTDTIHRPSNTLGFLEAIYAHYERA